MVLLQDAGINAENQRISHGESDIFNDQSTSKTTGLQ